MALPIPEHSPEYTGDTPERGSPSWRMEVETRRRPQICLWKDLSLSDVETLEGAGSVGDVRRALHHLLSPEESDCQLRDSALLDLYSYTVHFCQDRGLSKEQTSCLFSIIKETHAVCAETPLGNVDECYQHFKELLMCHAVHRPPFSVAVFTQQQLLHISDYVLKTYFRHFKLYKYVFTPQVGLDLTISYDDDEEAGSSGQEMEKNDITEDDMSTPGAENRKTEQQDQTVGGPPGEHMDQQPSQEVREMSKTELQDNLKKRTETKTGSPGGGTEKREETRSPGGGTEGREETKTRSPGGGTEGREETKTRSPGGGTEEREETKTRSRGGTEGREETKTRSSKGKMEGKKGSAKRIRK